MGAVMTASPWTRRGGVYGVEDTNATDMRTKKPVQATNNNGDDQNNAFVVKVGPAAGSGGR